MGAKQVTDTCPKCGNAGLVGTPTRAGFGGIKDGGPLPPRGEAYFFKCDRSGCGESWTSLPAKLPKVGDTVVEKNKSGTYDISKIALGDGRDGVRPDVESLDQAKFIAREALAPDGSKVWYRDYRDPTDHLEEM